MRRRATTDAGMAIRTRTISATTTFMKDVAVTDAATSPMTVASRPGAGAIGDEIETKEVREATAEAPAPSIVIAATAENAQTETIGRTRAAVGTASSAPNVVATVQSAEAATEDASESSLIATMRGAARATPDTVAGMTMSLSVAMVIGGA